MVCCQRRSHGAPQVVPDPDGGTASEMIVELDHVLDNLDQGIGRGVDWGGRAAVAPHIRRDATPALGREGLELGAPYEADLWPPVEKDHQRPIDRPGLPEAGCVAGRAKAA